MNTPKTHPLSKMEEQFLKLAKFFGRYDFKVYSTFYISPIEDTIETVTPKVTIYGNEFTNAVEMFGANGWNKRISYISGSWNYERKVDGVLVIVSGVEDARLPNATYAVDPEMIKQLSNANAQETAEKASE